MKVGGHVTPMSFVSKVRFGRELFNSLKGWKLSFLCLRGVLCPMVLIGQLKMGAERPGLMLHTTFDISHFAGCNVNFDTRILVS